MKNKLNRAIPFLLIFTIIFLIIDGLFIFISLSNVSNNQKLYTKSTNVKDLIFTLSTSLYSAQISQNNYILNQDPTALNSFNQSVSQYQSSYKELSNLLLNDPVESNNLSMLNEKYLQRLAVLNQVNYLFQTQGYTSAKNLMQTNIGRLNQSEITNLANTINQEEELKIIINEKNTINSLSILFIVLVLSILSSITLLITIYIALRKDEDIREKQEFNKNDLLERLIENFYLELIQIKNLGNGLNQKGKTLFPDNIQNIVFDIEKKSASLVDEIEDIRTLFKLSSSKIKHGAEIVDLDSIFESLLGKDGSLEKTDIKVIGDSELIFKSFKEILNGCEIIEFRYANNENSNEIILSTGKDLTNLFDPFSENGLKKYLSCEILKYSGIETKIDKNIFIFQCKKVI